MGFFTILLGVGNLLLLIFIQVSNRKFQKQINSDNIQLQRQLNDSWIGIKYSDCLIDAEKSMTGITSGLVLNFSLFINNGNSVHNLKLVSNAEYSLSILDGQNYIHATKNGYVYKFKDICEPSNVNLDPNIVASETAYSGAIVSFLKHVEYTDIENSISSIIYKGDEFSIPVKLYFQNSSESEFRYRLYTSIHFTISYDTMMRADKTEKHTLDFEIEADTDNTIQEITYIKHDVTFVK
ncbi:hypothetical protein HCB27_14315 [Listeria booriae]|uniref:Uncharacterized protein n=1 Tax=Listeria booriae TaxID=1552123 RepID=A0A7X1D9K5_9LIST|nr:hypothetical protein [Listeria booriae]MBC2177777.1 hypothetical protein [Listeria booriae]MBC2177802.1 hypothetical protein [Listeria booriae]